MPPEIQHDPSAPDELTQHGSPDELTSASAGAGTWSLPSDEGTEQQPPHVPHGVDYSAGMFVGGIDEAAANAVQPEHYIGARVDVPRSFEMPHEATHRRFEPPSICLINQAAAGTTMFALTNKGLHYVKIIAMILTLDAAGTVTFVQGSNDGTAIASLTGAIPIGGANAPGFVLPPADLQNPWLWGSPDQALGITTATGKAQGWAIVAYAPYDQ